MENDGVDSGAVRALVLKWAGQAYGGSEPAVLINGREGENVMHSWRVVNALGNARQKMIRRTGCLCRLLFFIAIKISNKNGNSLIAC